jgi:hypothetical protein
MAGSVASHVILPLAIPLGQARQLYFALQQRPKNRPFERGNGISIRFSVLVPLAERGSAEALLTTITLEETCVD